MFEVNWVLAGATEPALAVFDAAAETGLSMLAPSIQNVKLIVAITQCSIRNQSNDAGFDLCSLSLDKHNN